MPKDSHLKETLRLAGQYLILGGLVALPPLFLYLDTSVLGNTVEEQSITEFSQSAILVGVSLIFWSVSARYKSERGFTILATGLFITMLIREQNDYLKAIQEGLWEILVLGVLIVTLYRAWKERASILPGLSRFLYARAGATMAVGVLLLLIYTRLYGIEEIWKGALGRNYKRVIKNMSEEGMETMAYLIILYASFLYSRLLKRTAGQNG